MTRLRLFALFTATALGMLGGLILWAADADRYWRGEELPRIQQLVTRLGLTDLALWTEARYARHPSQTDFFSAFQDFPGSPEHFPAGSIVPPPPGLMDPGSYDASAFPARRRDPRGDRRGRDVGLPGVPDGSPAEGPEPVTGGESP